MNLNNEQQERLSKVIKENLWGYSCKDCTGTGGNGLLGDGFRKCLKCSGTGIVDWQIAPMTKFIAEELSLQLSEIIQIAEGMKKIPLINMQYEQDKDGNPILGTLTTNNTGFQGNIEYNKALTNLISTLTTLQEGK